MNYLRVHHYQFGKSDLSSQLMTQNQVDYKDPGLLGKEKIPPLDNHLLRQTHWTLGDGYPEMYNTTYNIVHTSKKGEHERSQGRGGSLDLKGNVPMTYLTDYRENYIIKRAGPPDNIDNLNKKTNFNFGEMKSDFSTTS